VVVSFFGAMAGMRTAKVYGRGCNRHGSVLVSRFIGGREYGRAMSLYAVVVGDGRVTGGWIFPDTVPPLGRVYEWQVEQGRIDYRLNFGFKPERPRANDRSRWSLVGWISRGAGTDPTTGRAER
jgi:hypothetical protein